jgi:hypothetical protein
VEALVAAEAFFKTSQTPDGTVFAIQPAKRSRAVFFLALMSVAVLFGILSLPLFPFVKLVVIGLWIIFLGMPVIRSFSDGKLRQPFTIVANRGGLLVRDEFYPSGVIAELALVAPTGLVIAASPGVAFAGTGVVGGSVALGANLGAAMLQSASNAGRVMAERQNARAICLTLRKRSHSKPIPIVHCLTAQTGQALMTDLIEAMK